VFTPDAIDAVIGVDAGGEPTGQGLWDRVARSAFLEADTPTGRPSTGRQFVNDEVYRAGCRQQELRRRDTFVPGIHHYVRMRYDSAREQLRDLRRRDPAGSSGARFAVPEGPGPALPSAPSPSDADSPAAVPAAPVA